jgi:subtilisin family serine protease
LYSRRAPAVALVLALALWMPCAARAQNPVSADPVDTAYWVFLKPAAADSPLPPALGPEALARRHAQGITIDATDRPLPRSVVRRIAATGAHVRTESRWLRAISVDADARALARLRRLRDVAEIRRVNGMSVLSAQHGPPAPAPAIRDRAPAPPYATDNGQRTTDNLTFVPDSAYGPNIGAFRELSIPTAHTLGFTGRSVRIAIIDTGFRADHEALVLTRVVGTRDFIQADAVVSDQPGDTPGQDAHGTRVFSLLAGNRPGSLLGSAFEAEYLLAKVDREPGDTRADEDRWVAALEWADSMGARVINSSLGYRYDFTDKPPYTLDQLNGRTTITSRAAAAASRRGLVLVNAIGNRGPQPGSLVAPADADSIIAVGAIDSLGRPADFGGSSTSRGPTGDGRFKPELVARGVRLTTASGFLTTSYEIVQGTSFSSPLISGSAALVLQAWPSLNPVAVRLALILSATRANNPDNNVGHGTPNVASAILFPGGLFTGDITGTSQGVLTTLAPTFGWVAPQVHPDIRPVQYRLEIARDSSFTSLVYADSVSDTFSHTVRRALRKEPRLFWRIIATAPAGLRRATNVAGPFAAPQWVRLVSFSGTVPSFTTSARPTIIFDPLPAPPPAGPLLYDLQVLSAQTGLPVQTVRNITGNSVTLTESLTPNTPYLYRLIARAPTGEADTAQSIAPFVYNSTNAPPSTTLYQNFPNPFPRDGSDSGTQIWFDLHEPATVELSVYDLRGRLVRRLIPGPGCEPVTLTAGLYGRGTPALADACTTMHWDGTDDDGERVARGVYILRMRAGSSDQTRRILYLGPQ